MKKIFKILLSLFIVLAICIITEANVSADTLWQEDDTITYTYYDPTEMAEGDKVTIKLLTSDTAFMVYFQGNEIINQATVTYEVVDQENKIIKVHNNKNGEELYMQLDEENEAILEVSEDAIEELEKKQIKDEINELSDIGKKVLEWIVYILTALGVSGSTILLFFKGINSRIRKNKADLLDCKIALEKSQDQYKICLEKLGEANESIKELKEVIVANYKEQTEKRNKLNELIVGELENE